MKTSSTLSLLLSGAFLAATPALHADSFTTPGIFQYHVGTTGTYQVTAAGGGGGGAADGGGAGAVIGGDFLLTSGMTLDLSIGQLGARDVFGNGGGGTVVSLEGIDVLLLDAGGGGGGGFTPGSNATLTTNSGGSSGSTGHDGSGGPGAGGGYLGKGSTVGGVGGIAAGGGGGYSGGDAGSILSDGGGGGGSSYYDSSILNLTEAATNKGNGYVTISLLTPSAAVTPEPSSLFLLGTGVFGVAGAIRRRLRP